MPLSPVVVVAAAPATDNSAPAIGLPLGSVTRPCTTARPVRRTGTAGLGAAGVPAAGAGALAVTTVSGDGTCNIAMLTSSPCVVIGTSAVARPPRDARTDPCTLAGVPQR